MNKLKMYIKKIKKIFPLVTILIALFAAPLSIFAQTGSGPADNSIYFINSYDYSVNGITRHYALDYRTRFIIGGEFTGISDLEQYFNEITQILINERLFDSVSIEYTIGNVSDDRKYPVDLIVYLADTRNLMIIPFPEYNSNDGFELSFIVVDNNFLGMMSPLKLNLGYKNNAENLNFFTLRIDSEIPLKFFGLYWNIDFDHDLQYSPDMPSPWYYRNTTGISAEIPVKRATLTAGFSESFYYNQENPRRYWKDAYGRIQEGLYMTSSPYISWEIPTGFFFIVPRRLNIILDYQPFSAMSSMNGRLRIS